MHCNVTDHPSEEWTAQQIQEAFPWEAPRYLILIVPNPTVISNFRVDDHTDTIPAKRTEI
jgi:hypothetical protein